MTRIETITVTCFAVLTACSGEDPAEECSTTRSIIAGEVFGGEFVPIHDGSSLMIVTGVQAGLWAMPTIRCIGCGDEGSMSADVELTTGEPVGEIRVTLRPTRIESGEMQVEYFRIPIAPDEESARRFYDKQASFLVAYQDSCSVIESRSTVTLRRGQP